MQFGEIPMFRRKLSLLSSRSKSKTSKKPEEVDSKLGSRQHGIKTHKTVLFIVIALRTSNPTNYD
jgi:hypothetical protein